jgi:hypothetical protein
MKPQITLKTELGIEMSALKSPQKGRIANSENRRIRTTRIVNSLICSLLFLTPVAYSQTNPTPVAINVNLGAALGQVDKRIFGVCAQYSDYSSNLINQFVPILTNSSARYWWTDLQYPNNTANITTDDLLFGLGGSVERHLINSITFNATASSWQAYYLTDTNTNVGSYSWFQTPAGQADIIDRLNNRSDYPRYGITHFEIWNEPNVDQAGHWPAPDYARYVTDCSYKIRLIAPTMKIGVALTDNYVPNWDKDVLDYIVNQGNAASIHYATYHAYNWQWWQVTTSTFGSVQNDRYYAKVHETNNEANVLRRMKTLLNSYNRGWELALTEWNVHPNFDPNAPTDPNATCDMGAAIFQASMLQVFMNEGVNSAQIFLLRSDAGSNFGMVQDSAANIKRPPFYVFDWYGRYFKGTRYQTNVSGPRTTWGFPGGQAAAIAPIDCAYVEAATAYDSATNGVCTMIVNKHLTDSMTVSVNFSGGSANASAQIATLNASGGVWSTVPTIAVTNVNPTNNTYNITIPAHSVTMITTTATLGGNSGSARCDFNGDRINDLFWRDAASTGSNSIWYSGNSGNAATATQGVDLNWKLADAADMNGDGNADIIWRNTITGENGIWIMTGVNYSSWGSLPTETDLKWQIATTGDLNNDGKPDLIWRNAATGENRVWMMNGTSFISNVSITSVSDTNWKLICAADMNQDGKTDLIWRNPTSGDNQVWIMSGTTYLSSATMPFADSNWQMAAAQDMNGDGQPDIVWRYLVGNGDCGAWIMQGATTVASWQSFTSVTDQNWQILGKRHVPAVSSVTSSSPAKVVWSYATGASGYSIERKTGSTGAYALVGNAAANATVYWDTSVVGSTTYFYRVKTLNGSPYSNEMSVTTPTFITLLNENFNATAAGGVPTGWTMSAPTNTTSNVQAFPTATNKSIKLYDNSTTTLCSATKTFTAATDWLFGTFSFYASANGATFQLRSGTVVAVDLLLKNGSLIYRNTAGTEITVMPYTVNTWYVVKIVPSVSLKTFDLYVGGVRKVIGGAFRTTTATNIDRVVFGTDIALKSTTYIDDVLIQK